MCGHQGKRKARRKLFHGNHVKKTVQGKGDEPSLIVLWLGQARGMLRIFSNIKITGDFIKKKFQ